jgi:CRP-like cAMP-binding protein
VGGLRLLVLPVPRFLQLIREHYPLARNLISQLSNLLERVGQQVCLCQARSAPVLVARYLLECLTENRDILDIRPLHMTAQEVGVARETLSRVLAGLCKQGLIEYSRGQVRIVDRPGLRDLASNL